MTEAAAPPHYHDKSYSNTPVAYNAPIGPTSSATPNNRDVSAPSEMPAAVPLHVDPGNDYHRDLHRSSQSQTHREYVVGKYQELQGSLGPGRGRYSFEPSNPSTATADAGTWPIYTTAPTRGGPGAAAGSPAVPGGCQLPMPTSAFSASPQGSAYRQSPTSANASSPSGSTEGGQDHSDSYFFGNIGGTQRRRP